MNNPRSGQVMRRLGMRCAYSYEELVRPKNQRVTFRLYQLTSTAFTRLPGLLGRPPGAFCGTRPECPGRWTRGKEYGIIPKESCGFVLPARGPARVLRMAWGPCAPKRPAARLLRAPFAAVIQNHMGSVIPCRF